MPEHEVFVSTGGFRDIPSNAVSRLSSEGITKIELSGGEREPDLNLDSLRPGIKFQLHNYFPPADPPFVYNLASLDQKIVKRTFDCLSRSIALSAECHRHDYQCPLSRLVPLPWLARGCLSDLAQFPKRCSSLPFWLQLPPRN